MADIINFEEKRLLKSGEITDEQFDKILTKYEDHPAVKDMINAYRKEAAEVEGTFYNIALRNKNRKNPNPQKVAEDETLAFENFRRGLALASFQNQIIEKLINL